MTFTANEYPKIAAEDATEEQLAEAKAVGWETSVNMMSGRRLWIRSDSKGGCCDPATETYWSM